MTRNQYNPDDLQPQPKDSGSSGGLSMGEVLMLPDNLQPIVTWMMRKGEVSRAEVAGRVGETEEVVGILLDELIDRGFVEENLVAGEWRYTTVLAVKKGGQISQKFLQTAVGGNPLAIIANPPRAQAVAPGSIFELSVTVNNQGGQSALIDIFIDDVSHILTEWCVSPRERLALGSQQSGEVIFQFRVPVQTPSNTYNYQLVIDAPLHYPEDTPIRYSRQVQVLPTLQDAVRVNDPTFILDPATSSRSPAVLQPGEMLPVQVVVHNRSDRVDNFRASCVDLPQNWFSVRYPEGLKLPGLVTESDGLNLNPGTKGEIFLLLQPPRDAVAGSYFPTVRVYSANNPDLALLDVIYLNILPFYLLNVELRTILGKVKRMAGLYEVRLTNLGNTARELILEARTADEEDVCVYTLAGEQERQPEVIAPAPSKAEKIGEALNQGIPTSLFPNAEEGASPKEEEGNPLFNKATKLKESVSQGLSKSFGSKVMLPRYTQVRVLPGGVVGIGLKVQPIKWWRRPIYGGVRLINFSVELTDTEQLPLPNPILQGTLLWESRPWWQFLLLFLTTFGIIAGIIFVIWSLFFKPVQPPKILEFSSQDISYQEASGDVIRLNLQIRNPNQLELVKITSQSPDGTASGQTIIYDFSQGIPNELKEACSTIQEVLACQNLITDARKAGDYIFEISIFSKKEPGVFLASAKTPTIKISAFPLPKIIEFVSTKPIYEEINKVAMRPEGKVAPEQGNPATAPPSTPAPTAANGVVASTSPSPKFLVPTPQILLNWKIINPGQLKELRLIGRSPDGSVSSEMKIYNFSQGVPEPLKKYCIVEEMLICQNFPTDAGKAGDYIFELIVITQKGEGVPSSSAKTDTIKIQAKKIIPKIVEFKVDGKDALPKYIFEVKKENKDKPINLLLSWKVEGGENAKIEILPAPGTVAIAGSLPYPVSQKPGLETITLKVTSTSGDQVERSISLETFEIITIPSPAPVPSTIPLPVPIVPASQSPSAPSSGTGSTSSPNQNSPSPTQPGTPAELPPQLD